MDTEPLETIYFILNYFDGPITGVTSFRGVPHYFDAQFDKISDSYTQYYRLTVLSEDTLRVVLAAREGWRRLIQTSNNSVALDEDRKLQTDMDNMIAHDCTLSSPFLAKGDFIRLRETGTDEESFAVAWTPVDL